MMAQRCKTPKRREEFKVQEEKFMMEASATVQTERQTREHWSRNTATRKKKEKKCNEDRESMRIETIYIMKSQLRLTGSNERQSRAQAFQDERPEAQISAEQVETTYEKKSGERMLSGDKHH